MAAKEINWKDLRCQEASILSKETKIDCAQPAVAIVWHNKDRRAYSMCLGCSIHNIRNRGGILLAIDVQAMKESGAGIDLINLG